MGFLLAPAAPSASAVDNGFSIAAGFGGSFLDFGGVDSAEQLSVLSAGAPLTF